jgi:hypothetical protein
MGNVDVVTPEADKNPPAEMKCSSCGEGLAPGQDWCLACGTAAPGRLSRRPGGRAALTTVALTLALTTGAVAASYAALSNAPIKKGDVTYPRVLAQQVQPPATTETTPEIPKPPKKQKPSSSSSSSSGSAKAAAVTAKAATGSSSSSSSSKSTKTKTEPPAPSLITIPQGAGALYDPSARALFSDDDPHDPAAVYDDDKESSWAVTSNGTGDLLVGYVIDLKKARSVQRLELLTDTPGFRAEIYGANADELPPLIADSRWAHLKDRDKVDQTSKEGGKPGDGKERITISDGSQKYRYILLWFSTPAPTVAPDPPSRTVRLFDLKLYG